MMSCGKCVRVFAYCIVAGLFYSGCSTFRREVFHRTDHSRSSDYDQIRLMMDQTLAFYGSSCMTVGIRSRHNLI